MNAFDQLSDIYNRVRANTKSDQRLILNSFIRISMNKTECKGCQRLHKQLQVQKADYEFEIKKIKEDQSTEKAMYEIHLQKEVRRWQENYHKEQSLREDESRNWLLKYDATVKKFEEEISSMKSKHMKTLQQSISSLKSAHEQKYEATVASYEQKIERLQADNSENVSNMKNDHESKVRNLQESHEESMTRIKKAHKALMDEKVKSYESKILGTEVQLKKQCELHRKTKNEFQESQGRLYEEIFGYKKKIIELENKIESQSQQIGFKKTTIQGLQSKIVSLNCEKEEAIAKLKQGHETNLEEARANFKNKIKSVYEDALSYCNQYQESINKMEQNRANEKELYLNNLEEIEQTVECRLSRPEDLEELQKLRSSLAKKNKECELLSEELKWFRLELQNKEQTYNKIFVSIGGHNENFVSKRKQFKLRRQGKSATTVREVLHSINSGNLERKAPLIPKNKVL